MSFGGDRMTAHATHYRTLLVAACLSVSSVAGAQSLQLVSQPRPQADELLSRTARLHVENVTLGIALVRLMESSGIALAFSPSRLPADAIVSCMCDTITVGEALRVLLAKTSFSVRESDGRVVLIPSSTRRPADEQ